MPPYSYSWSNTAITEDISSLGVGTYTVTVTDACSTVASTSATINVSSGVNKYLYLTNPAQGLDRIDPVATVDITTVTSTEIGEAITIAPSDGVAIWHENGIQTPQYKIFDGVLNSFGTEATAPTVGNNKASVLMTAQSPVDDTEAFLLEITDGKEIYLHQWNGSGWTAGSFNPLGPVKNKAVQTAVMTYASDGTAMLVWDDATADNLIHYR
jgi:hypothetical protein